MNPLYKKLVSSYLENVFEITFRNHSSVDSAIKERITKDLTHEINKLALHSSLGTSVQALALQSEFNSNTDLFIDYAIEEAIKKANTKISVAIMSRKRIEKMSENLFPDNVALISITDFGWSFAELKNKPRSLLQLAFDDVDNDIFEDELGRCPREDERISIENKYHMLSDEQAHDIASFIRQTLPYTDTIICQCEHGQSRSAAVAAILEYLSQSGIRMFSDDKYYPNKAVFKKVLKALYK